MPPSRAARGSKRSTSLSAPGNKTVAEKWAWLGREATRRKAFEVSGDAFKRALASGLRADLVDEARVGVALAAVRTGRDAKDEIAAAVEAVERSLATIERAIAKDEKAGKRNLDRKLTLAWVLCLRER